MNKKEVLDKEKSKVSEKDISNDDAGNISINKIKKQEEEDKEMEKV